MGHRGATTSHGGIAHLGAALGTVEGILAKRQGRIWLAIFFSRRFLATLGLLSSRRGRFPKKFASELGKTVGSRFQRGIRRSDKALDGFPP